MKIIRLRTIIHFCEAAIIVTGVKLNHMRLHRFKIKRVYLIAAIRGSFTTKLLLNPTILP